MNKAKQMSHLIYEFNTYTMDLQDIGNLMWIIIDLEHWPLLERTEYWDKYVTELFDEHGGLVLIDFKFNKDDNFHVKMLKEVCKEFEFEYEEFDGLIRFIDNGVED